jgi:hypothetical protein
VIAVKIYCTMEKKNTAAGGFGKKLRVGYVLFVYGCTFCIADGDLVVCS